MNTRTLLLLFLTGTTLAQATKDIRISWLPVYSEESGRTTEGIDFDLPPNIQLDVRIEATLHGKPLPIAEGRIDSRDHFVVAPIRNLDTYRLVRLVIRKGDQQWTLERPKKEFVIGRMIL